MVAGASKCLLADVSCALVPDHESHDLLPLYRKAVEQTLADPDEVRRDTRFPNSLLFARWFPDVKGGKFVVVVVVADSPPQSRYWIVTAYMARQLSGGTLTWKRP
jgi:hypothetical protein